MNAAKRLILVLWLTLLASVGTVSALSPDTAATGLSSGAVAKEGTWEKSGTPLESRLAEPLQIAGRHQGNGISAYDFEPDSLLAAKTATAETRLTTVLGSGRDVAPYANRPGFNVLNMDSLPASEWPRQNALWLNQAITRGDNIWLVTDPAKHTQLMQQLGKSSYYLDLELPMLQQYNGVNAIPKYITSP